MIAQGGNMSEEGRGNQWQDILYIVGEYISRLTIVSRKGKKKHVICEERMSYVFTGSTALKLVNTLNKMPIKSYFLVIKDSARSNCIESVTQKWRKSAPPILSTSHCEFKGTSLCAHARKTIP